MEEIKRLGILGMSEGNGHPYSWSAIINGYDSDFISECGFPSIPEYLSKQNFPTDFIQNAEVSHLWTQDKEVSRSIANSCFIKTIVKNPEEMIGKVDGVLLARDDAQNHYYFAKPFLKAGLPIFIDKPLALNKKEAKKIFSRQKYSGQIFSCSTCRFSKELVDFLDDPINLDNVISIEALVPNSWNKYSVHAIEPIVMIMGNEISFKSYDKIHKGSSTTLRIKTDKGTNIKITSTGEAAQEILIKVRGKNYKKNILFKDSFFSFKSALQIFINNIDEKKQIIDEKFVLSVVELIELG